MHLEGADGPPKKGIELYISILFLYIHTVYYCIIKTSTLLYASVGILVLDNSHW